MVDMVVDRRDRKIYMSKDVYGILYQRLEHLSSDKEEDQLLYGHKLEISTVFPPVRLEGRIFFGEDGPVDAVRRIIYEGCNEGRRYIGVQIADTTNADTQTNKQVLYSVLESHEEWEVRIKTLEKGTKEYRDAISERLRDIMSDNGISSEDMMMNPLLTQVNGSHYKGKGIQPVVYIYENRLDWFEGTIIKYITRWKEKHNGSLVDLYKCKHILEMYIWLQEEESL